MDLKPARDLLTAARCPRHERPGCGCLFYGSLSPEVASVIADLVAEVERLQLAQVVAESAWAYQTTPTTEDNMPAFRELFEALHQWRKAQPAGSGSGEVAGG